MRNFRLISFVLLCLVFAISISAEQVKVTEDTRAAVTTLAAQNVGNFGALLRANVLTSNTYPWEIYFEYKVSTYGAQAQYVYAEPRIYQSVTSRTLTAVVDGLEPATTYRFRVIASSPGAIVYGSWLTFTTTNVTTYITEGFETLFPPDGWETNSSMIPYNWIKAAHCNNFPHWNFGNWNIPTGVDMGDYSAYCTYEGLDRLRWTSQWLITPQIMNVQAGDSISFWYGNAGRNFREYVEIRLSTTDSDTLSFTTVVDTFDYNQNGTSQICCWRYESYDLSAYAGQNIYIAIRESEDRYYQVRANMLDNFTYKGKMPQVGFQASENTVPVNQFVKLTAKGTYKSAEWNFGDGTTGSGVTVSHQYSSPGWYSVTMTITGLDGNTYTMTRPNIVQVTNSNCTFSGSPGLERDALLPGETNVPLIKMNVKNPGSLAQYLTSVTVNLTCDDLADLTAVKLWSNTSNSLSSATLLDTKDPASSLTYTTNVTLNANATKYFWITADIASSATIGNTILATLPVSGVAAGGNSFPYIAIAPDTPWIVTDYQVTLPENGAFAGGATELVWEFTDGASFDGFSFSIQVDDDPAFASPEIDVSGIEASRNYGFSQAISGLAGYDSLVDGTAYYWRVQAATTYGAGSYTDGSNYFVWDSVNQAPSVPSGTFSPSSGVEVTNLTPVFAWSYATDPDDAVADIKYRIRVATNSSMNNVILAEWTVPGQNLYQFGTALDDASDYYWQVRSADPADLRSAFSEVQHFRTNTAPVTATLPSPLSPPAGGGTQTFFTYGNAMASVNWLSGDLPTDLSLSYVSNSRYPGVSEFEFISNRYWMFEATGGSSWIATVRLYYNDEDLGMLLSDEYSLRMLKTENSGQSWDEVTVTSRNTDDNWIEGSFSSFSDVILAGPDTTLPVQLSSFTGVYSSGSSVNLRWITESECGILGYRVLRSENDLLSNAFNMTPDPIASVGAISTFEYSWIDTDLDGQEKLWYWLESIEYDGGSNFYGPITVLLQDGEDPGDTPGVKYATELTGNFPNPFNPMTTISYTLSEDGVVYFTVFDLKGRKVEQMTVKGKRGNNALTWDARDLATGIYLINMNTGDRNQTRKVMLLK